MRTSAARSSSSRTWWITSPSVWIARMACATTTWMEPCGSLLALADTDTQMHRHNQKTHRAKANRHTDANRHGRNGTQTHDQVTCWINQGVSAWQHTPATRLQHATTHADMPSHGEAWSESSEGGRGEEEVWGGWRRGGRRKDCQNLYIIQIIGGVREDGR